MSLFIPIWKKRSETTIQSRRCYLFISELPLYKFVHCLVDKKLTELVIEGEYHPQELELIWTDILSQYSDEIGDHEFILYTNLLKEVTILSIQLQTINSLVDVLWKVYDKRLCTELNKLLNTSFKFNPNDNNAYHNDLTRCVNRSKKFKIELAFKMQKFEAIRQKFDSPAKQPTREYFDKILITLSDHVRYRLDDEISVFEFCNRIKRFNKYQDISNNQNPN